MLFVQYQESYPQKLWINRNDKACPLIIKGRNLKVSGLSFFTFGIDTSALAVIRANRSKRRGWMRALVF